MTEPLLDDDLWATVRGARPAPPPDRDSPLTPAAQALLAQILSGEGGAAAARDRAARARRAARPRRPMLGAIGVTLLVGAAVAIGVVALLGLGRERSLEPGAPHRHGHGAALIGAGPQTAPHSSVLPGSAKLVAEAPDPDGGLPWAMREVRTSRGQACLAVGRLRGGTIGSLGEDGAWGNDGGFHAIPPQGSVHSLQLYCGGVDADGNSFLNVADEDAEANAAGDSSTIGSARGRAAQVAYCAVFSRSGRGRPGPGAPCPAGSLRDLSYGFLGPQVVSVSYLDARGIVRTQPTTGPDGAYLLVRAHVARCALGDGTMASRCATVGGSFGPEVESGTIVAVHYRTGRVCRLPKPDAQGMVRLATCPLVGYRAPRTPRVTAAELATPVKVSIRPAARYCFGDERHCAQIHLEVSFRARVAVTSLNSYYEAVIDMPPHAYTPGARTGCPGAGSWIGPTQSTIRAGQQLHWDDPMGILTPDCAGNIVHVTVAYVANTRLGLNGIGTGRFPSPGRGAIVVGRASVRLPGR